MTPPVWALVVIAVIGSGGIGVFISTLGNRPKVRAEAKKENATADSVANSALLETLKFYREDVTNLRAEVVRQAQEGVRQGSEIVRQGEEIVRLTTENGQLKQQIGILTRHERETMVKNAHKTAVIETALAVAGIPVPDVAPPAVQPMATRATDAPPPVT